MSEKYLMLYLRRYNFVHAISTWYIDAIVKRNSILKKVENVSSVMFGSVMQRYDFNPPMFKVAYHDVYMLPF